MLTPWKKSYDKTKQYIKKQRHYFADKVHIVKGMVFPDPIDRGAWRSTVHEVTKSRTRLSDETITKKRRKMALSHLRTTSVTIFWLHVTETLTQTATSKMELIYSCQQKFQKSAGFRHGWIQKPEKITMDLLLSIS